MVEKDVIISMNSDPVSSANQLRNDVSNMRPGDTVVFKQINIEEYNSYNDK